MKEFTVFGLKQHDYIPVMVKSKIGQNVDTNLLSIKFEMNPLDKVCAFIIHIELYFKTKKKQYICIFGCSAN